MRYALAAALWLLVLVALEGRGSLRLDGRGWRLFWLGSLGFAGFNLFAYTGLAHARPETASLIVALGPLLTALVLWHRTKVRPAPATFALLGVALLGVALVVSAGHPSSILHGALGWGEVLVLAGVLSFILYSLGAAEFASYSPLRYTALTASLGWLTIAGATLVGDRDRARRGHRGRADVGLAADRVPGDSRRLRRRAHVERRDQGDRPAERRPLQQPDPRDDVRDRDRRAATGRTRPSCSGPR